MLISASDTGRLQGRKPGEKFEGDDDGLLSGPNFLLAKLAVLKHLTQ